MSQCPALLLRAQRFFFLCLFACSVALFAACSSGGGGGDESGDNSEAPAGSRAFNTNCGTAVDGNLINPISESDGILATATAVGGTNTLVVQRPTGPQLIRLTGIRAAENEFQRRRALEILEGFLGQVIIFESEPGCVATNNEGASAASASVFRASDGASAAETLLQAGAALVEDSPQCSSSAVLPCYRILEEQNLVQTGARITNFLWKPVSERDGNLVILLNPGGATVFVNGEAAVNFGPSNARGTTARTNRPGCSYGAGAVVEAIDSAGRILLFPGDELSLTIANGCNRVEF